MRKKYLFRQTSLQTGRHGKVGSCAKSWQYDWNFTPMGVLLLTLAGPGFHPCLCQVWQGLLTWNWSWGKKSDCFSTQMPKCPMCMKKTGKIITQINVLDMLSRPDDAPTEVVEADLRSKHGVPTQALHLCPLTGFFYSHHKVAISSLYESKWKKLEWPRRHLSWSLQIDSHKCLWCEDVLLLKQREKGKWNEEVVWLLLGDLQANKSRLVLI